MTNHVENLRSKRTNISLGKNNNKLYLFVDL